MIRMSVAEAAKSLGVSASTVRRRIERGELWALRELVDGRARVWVLIEEQADDLPRSVDEKRAMSPVQLRPAAELARPTVKTTAVDLESWRRAPQRVVPPTDWVVGWALRDPRTLDWVAPSVTSRPRMTTNLGEARVHATRESALIYADWLPIEVEPAEVAVDAEHAHLDQSLRRAS